MSPILFWNDVVYLPNEHYCFVPFTNLRSILWVFFVAYGNPLIFLLLIYLRITIFLHQQTNNQTFVVNRRQERDLLVIRRILITVGLLMILGIPAIILLIMLYITGEEHPLIFGIGWLFVSLSILGLSLSQVIFTPQLKSIVLRKCQRDRVVLSNDSLTSSIQLRYNTINQ